MSNFLTFFCLSFLTFPTIIKSSYQEDGNKQYSSYVRMPLCTPSDYVRYPQSMDDVLALVKEAIDRKTTIKAFGARHSQTDIICTEGIPVDIHGLKSFQFHPENNTATFGAGVIIHEAAIFLRGHGRALKTTPGYGNITISGAIGTGAHGSTLKHNSSLSSQVVGMTFVDGLGNVRQIWDEDNLRAFRVHLGLLGFITSVSFATEPLYKTRAYNYIAPDRVLRDGTLLKWLEEVDQMNIYWFPSLKEVVVGNWTIVDVSTPGEAFTYDHVPSGTLGSNIIAKYLSESFQRLAASTYAVVAGFGYSMLYLTERITQTSLIRDIPLLLPIYTEDGSTVQNPAVGYYDAMFSPTCRDDDNARLKCLWAHKGFELSILNVEIALALSDLPRFLDRVHEVLEEVPSAFPSQGVLMRFSRGSDSYMSTSWGKDVVHFEWYMANRNDLYRDPSANLAAYQTIAQIAVKDFLGRPHMGKNGLAYLGKDILDRILDPWARMQFIKKMQEYDPNGVFMNNFGRRLIGSSEVIDIDPRTTRCALLDNCFCMKDSDCGPTQYCGVVGEASNHTVCRTINDDKVLQRARNPILPIRLLDWALQNKPGLISSLAVKSSRFTSLISRIFGNANANLFG